MIRWVVIRRKELPISMAIIVVKRYIEMGFECVCASLICKFLHFDDGFNNEFVCFWLICCTTHTVICINWSIVVLLLLLWLWLRLNSFDCKFILLWLRYQFHGTWSLLPRIEDWNDFSLGILVDQTYNALWYQFCFLFSTEFVEWTLIGFLFSFEFLFPFES